MDINYGECIIKDSNYGGVDLEKSGGGFEVV